MPESESVLFTIFNPPCWYLEIEHIVVVVLVFAILYGLPSLIASSRKSRNFTQIVCCNLFLGLTGVGWIIAFIWALSTGGSYKHEQEYEDEHENKSKNSSHDEDMKTLRKH